MTPDEIKKAEQIHSCCEMWMERIQAAERREDDWTREALAAERAYSVDTKSVEGKLYDFNILHSNVETIVPAIYNSTPAPDIRRRFSSEDPEAKNYADMIERAISVQIDDNRLDTEVESLAQDAFIAGRGIVRLRFMADFQPDEMGQERPANERIAFEAVSWRDFRFGPAKRWEDVSWVAFRHSIPREEIEKLSDEDLLAAQAYGEAAATSDNEEDDTEVWEVWDKDKREVIFIRADDRKMFKRETDPLRLPDFFPVPKPVQPICVTGKLTPVCPFSVYKKLADELDKTTQRINKIISGLKVRGLVAGSAEDIMALARAEDNELVTADGLESLAQTGGLDKAIMWWPIETAMAVLKELYVTRETTKQAIYEITGISDIVRGASDAGETATAQNIKTQWGSLRIQKMQRLIQRQVRDIFVMMADIITTHFSPKTLQAMTGIQITSQMAQLMQQPVTAAYRVDIESDSTIKADLTRARGEMAEFLNGSGQFFSAMAPIIQADPSMAEPVAEIYSAFARQFSLGKQAEDALERMAAQAKQVAQQPRPNPEAEKMKADMQIKQAEMQADQQRTQAELQLKGQEGQQKLAIEGQKLQLDAERMQVETAIKRAELDIKRAELALKQQDLGLRADEMGKKLNERGEIERDTTTEDTVIERLGERLDAILGASQQSVEQLANVVRETATAPRKVIRDERGEIVGVQVEGGPTWSVVRDGQGQISGVTAAA